MRSRRRKDPRERMLFGFMLVALGVVFLLDRLDVLYLGRAWEWWPWIVIVFGTFRVALWSSAESVASGFGLMLFGGWFLVTVNHWYGFDWSNSWPLAIVAVGLSMVARVLLERLMGRPQDETPTGGEPHA